MEEKPKVYIETTIPSYLTSRPSNNLVLAGEQEVTRQWWDRRKNEFDLYISNFVIEEVSGGDVDAAKKRLNILEGIDILSIDDETIRIVNSLMDKGIFPEKAKVDVGHISVTSRHGLDYLLTWN